MACLNIEKEFLNNSTKADLVVIHKGGLRYVVAKKDQAEFTQGQIVKIKFNNIFIEELHLDSRDALTKLDKTIMELLENRLKELRDNPHRYFRFPSTIEIEVRLHEGYAGENGGIHSEMLGFTIYCGKDNLYNEPLNTPKSSLAEVLESINKETKSTISYCAYLVDPKATQKPFYVNVGGSAIQVPTAKDDLANPGLYIGISVGLRPTVYDYYDFEGLNKNKLESLGVFRSKADAMANGNTERYQAAEQLNEQYSKELANKNKLINNISTDLEQANKKIELLETQAIHSKQNHRMEVERLKNDVKAVEEKHARFDQNTKEKLLRIKEETQHKENSYKQLLEQAKQRGIWSLVGDVFKTIGATVGLCMTGFKLLFS